MHQTLSPSTVSACRGRLRRRKLADPGHRADRQRMANPVAIERYRWSGNSHRLWRMPLWHCQGWETTCVARTAEMPGQLALWQNQPAGGLSNATAPVRALPGRPGEHRRATAGLARPSSTGIAPRLCHHPPDQKSRHNRSWSVCCGRRSGGAPCSGPFRFATAGQPPEVCRRSGHGRLWRALLFSSPHDNFAGQPAIPMCFEQCRPPVGILRPPSGAVPARSGDPGLAEWPRRTGSAGRGRPALVARRACKALPGGLPHVRLPKGGFGWQVDQRLPASRRRPGVG